MTIHFLHDIRDGMRQWTWRLCSQTVFFLWTDCRTQFFFIQSGHFSKAIVSMFHLGCSWPNWAALWATFSWPFSTWQLSFSLLHILLLPRQPLLLLSCVFSLLYTREFSQDEGWLRTGAPQRKVWAADTTHVLTLGSTAGQPKATSHRWQLKPAQSHMSFSALASQSSPLWDAFTCPPPSLGHGQHP